MKITLPDNSLRELPEGSSGYDLAKDIGPGLAKSAIAVTINGVQRDLHDAIDADASVSIITIDSDEGVEIMRHTLTAQVLARAIKNLYPKSKLAIGPTVQDGFYYDVESDESISSDDLSKIEEEMKKIIKTKSAITKKLVSKKEALKIFKSNKEPYKEIIINESDQDDDFQLYYQDDEEFVDLCKGPHLPNLGFIGSFKLTKVSGAYWKGDSKNSMLTRIYGTAFSNDKDLQNHLENVEEALKRDHRKLGKEMDLFHFQDEAPGMVFWHPNGWTVYRKLRNFVRDRLKENNYMEVNTLQFIDRKFLKKTIEEGNSNNEIKEVFDDIELINSAEENSFLDWILKTKSIKNQDILDSENRWDELKLSNLKVSSSSKKKITREDYMTETLAKVYVRQEKYKEALKAYKILSLKYPEKISLFANQIKDLKKRL